MAAYLKGLVTEARSRGYRFDATKISRAKFTGTVEETSGQLLYEWQHLQRKLHVRAPQLFQQHFGVSMPDPHPLFRIVPGPVRDWERQ